MKTRTPLGRGGRGWRRAVAFGSVALYVQGLPWPLDSFFGDPFNREVSIDEAASFAVEEKAMREFQRQHFVDFAGVVPVAPEVPRHH